MSKKPPSVLFHKPAAQFYCRVGFTLNRKNKRVQAFQFLGKDERNAQRRALDLAEQWDEEVRLAKERFKEWLQTDDAKCYREFEDVTIRDLWRGYLPPPMVAFADSAFRQGIGFLPLWSTKPKVKVLHAITDTLIEQRKAQDNEVTVEKLVELFNDAEEQRVGLAGGKGISRRTFESQKRDLTNSLRMMDKTLTLKILDYQGLEKFVNAWMALPNGAGKKKGRIALRTAVNYCKTFKKCLDWAGSRSVLDYAMPKGIDRLFTFRDFNTADVRIYSHDQLRSLFATQDRRALFAMLALNFGWYQVDIQTFRWEHLKQIAGEWFVERKREKTKHQNRFSGCWYVWPQTRALLDKYAAPNDNRHGLVLLHDGDQLSSRQISYIVFGNDGGSRFKDFRKTGATWMENNVGVDVSRLFKANAQGASEKLYVQQSYLKLTAALKLWEAELIAAKVLP